MNPFSASVKNGSNEIIFSSETDLSTIREGSFIRIRGENVFYVIGKIDSVYPIKDFKADSRRSIIVKKDDHILVGDTLTLSYKEHQLEAIWDIKNPGKNYRVGDILSIKGGTPSVDLNSGEPRQAKIRVNEVGPNGEVVGIIPEDFGEYIEPPANTCEVFGGNGLDAVFEAEFKLIDNRKTFERVIDYIDDREENISILLNYVLPIGVVNGKLSVDKHKVFLTSPYLGVSNKNATFEIVKDYTPHYKLPLLVENSFSHEVIVNHALISLEQKVKELEDKLAALQSSKV